MSETDDSFARAVDAGASPSDDGRRSFGRAADAIGHCVLVFAFVPILVVLPNWLARQLEDPVARDPIAVLFVPVRAVITLLEAFAAGVGPRVVTGIIAGVLLWSWLAFGARVPRALPALVAGIVCGTAAASLLMLAAFARAQLAGEPVTLASWPVLQHLGTGAVCGAIAGPTAARLVRAASAAAA